MDHLPLSGISMPVSTINFLLRDEIFDNLDHIEDTIADYANSMSKELLKELSQGNPDFLYEHATFHEDLMKAIRKMEDYR